LNRLKNGKAPGLCNIPPELLKYGGTNCVKWLTSIFQSVWSTGVIPDDWCNCRGIIIPFYKGNGSMHDCQNYRGITLLSVPGKVFAHVLLSQVRERLQEKGGYSKVASHQEGQQLSASSR